MHLLHLPKVESLSTKSLCRYNRNDGKKKIDFPSYHFIRLDGYYDERIISKLHKCWMQHKYTYGKLYNLNT